MNCKLYILQVKVKNLWINTSYTGEDPNLVKLDAAQAMQEFKASQTRIIETCPEVKVKRRPCC